MNIIAALELLQGQVTNRTLKRVMGEVIVDLRSGSQLSVAMSKHPEVFSTLSCRTLSIGEQTGGFETMLRQIADYMEKEINASKGVKSALTYPIIASIATVVVVGILVGFVLPAFSNLYSSLGAKLPAMTRMMMDVSKILLRNNALSIMMALAIIGVVGLIYVKTPEGRYQMDKLTPAPAATGKGQTS